MKLETIYKKTKTGATQEWTIEVSDNRYRTHSGQVGGQITTNAWTVVYGKNEGKQMVLLILNKLLKKQSLRELKS